MAVLRAPDSGDKAASSRTYDRSAGLRLFGLPLFDFASGSDPDRGLMREHAHGIIAVGKIATGWIAIGFIAKGGLAIGSVATGIVAIGGVATGVFALGGCAFGGIVAGGLAAGFAAIGGLAVGYYAVGGCAIGKYLLSPMERSPEAIEFLRRWFPFLLME